MFNDLPKPLQEKVLEHLQKNNFPAAKALYDEYHQQLIKQLAAQKKSPKQPKQPQTASA